MQIAIVQFPGSNCERETKLAVLRAGMEPVEFLWNDNPEILSAMQGYIIVGGFSYEDRARSGVIAALDPIMKAIQQQAELGKPVLGLCNGAQILVETGLVPGLKDNQRGMALTHNKRVAKGQILGTGYYNAWVNLRVSDEHRSGAFTRHLKPSDILRIPVAHGEGRFVMPQGLEQEVKAKGLNTFVYCDAQGKIHPEFPTNPNGSMANLAAVSNGAGNVMAMMPHPERTPAGDAIFASMRTYIEAGLVVTHAPLAYQLPAAKELTRFQKAETARELVIELIITDNHALSVQKALEQAGISVKVKRQIHWEIACTDQSTYEQIINSGVLYNTNKEFAVSEKSQSDLSLVVRAKDDIIGQEKQQILERHLGIKGIQRLKHSVLWHLETDQTPAQSEEIRKTHILYNPHAHDCYYY